MLLNFYRSNIESVLAFSFRSWFGGIDLIVKNTGKPSKLVNVSIKTVGRMIL